MTLPNSIRDREKMKFVDDGSGNVGIRAVIVGGGGASAFTDLTDAPASYVGSSRNFVAVNTAETALEFVDPITIPAGYRLRVYNTADEITNTEYAQLTWSGNIAQLETNRTGTGAGRHLELRAWNGTGTSTSGMIFRTSAFPGWEIYAPSGGPSTLPGVFGQITGSSSASSGAATFLYLHYTANQSGTAAYNGIYLDVDQTALGSGISSLLTMRAGGVSKFVVSNKGILTSSVTETNYGTNPLNANSFTADLTYTADTANSHRVFLGTLALRGGAGIDYSGAQTVSIMQGDVYTAGATTLLSGQTLNIFTQSGSGALAEGRGLSISHGQLAGGGAITEFSGVRMTISTAAAATVYAFNFENAAYISNSRAIKIKNPAAGTSYTPLSTTDTGITLDSTDLILATTTSGDVQINPAVKLSISKGFVWTGGAAYTEEINAGTAGAADTIDWRLGNNQKSTLDENVTYTFTAPAGPCHLTLRMIQDGAGTNTVTWPATVKWSGGTQPTWDTTGTRENYAFFYWNGTNYIGSGVPNITP